MPWQEDRIHRWLAKRLAPACLVGSRMSDAAVLSPLRGRLVSCSDQTVAGVHFDSEARASLVGRKAAGRALSDLAATAASPAHLSLALSAPRATSEAWIRAAISAVAEAARAAGAELVGGDLCCSEGALALSVHATGTLAGKRQPPGRDRAQSGQCIVLTGPVGGSILGRHLRIEPRVRAGQLLFAAGATAMMDVSDGLAWDLFRLARASRARFEIDLVPIHRDARKLSRSSGQSAHWHALHDGEDHELIATLPARALRGLAAKLEPNCPGLQVIGRVCTGTGLSIVEASDDSAGKPAKPRSWRPDRDRGGWRHGGS